MPRAKKTPPPVKNMPYGANRQMNEVVALANSSAAQIEAAGQPQTILPEGAGAGPQAMMPNPAVDPMQAAADYQLINEADLLTSPTARPNEDIMAGISGPYAPPPTPQEAAAAPALERTAATLIAAYQRYPSPALKGLIDEVYANMQGQ